MLLLLPAIALGSNNENIDNQSQDIDQAAVAQEIGSNNVSQNNSSHKENEGLNKQTKVTKKLQINQKRYKKTAIIDFALSSQNFITNDKMANPNSDVAFGFHGLGVNFNFTYNINDYLHFKTITNFSPFLVYKNDEESGFKSINGLAEAYLGYDVIHMPKKLYMSLYIGAEFSYLDASQDPDISALNNYGNSYLGGGSVIGAKFSAPVDKIKMQFDVSMYAKIGSYNVTNFSALLIGGDLETAVGISEDSAHSTRIAPGIRFDAWYHIGKYSNIYFFTGLEAPIHYIDMQLSEQRDYYLSPIVGLGWSARI